MPDDLPILFDFPSGPEAAVIEGQRGERELPVVPLINTVLFPHMLTPLFVGRERSVSAVEEAMERHASEYALKRVTVDADVANACLFLASDVSRQITGADLPVDGGWAML